MYALQEQNKKIKRNAVFYHRMSGADTPLRVAQQSKFNKAYFRVGKSSF